MYEGDTSRDQSGQRQGSGDVAAGRKGVINGQTCFT